MIKVSQLNKVFSSKKSHGWQWWKKQAGPTEFVAVKDLSFEIHSGEFVALLGPNGAGKTTTLKMLTGILYPTSGEIRVEGFIPVKREHEFKKSISFVMAQKSQLFLELPVKDTFEFMMEIYNVNTPNTKKLVNELVERFNLDDKLDTHARRLSLGQRMKCELICSFLYQPKVIFLDEPTIGLDVNSVREVREFLKQTNRSLGTTVILTTHNMDDVEELCDRTIMINKGEKIYDGSTLSLKKVFGDERIIEFVLDDPQSISLLPSSLSIMTQNKQIIAVRATREQSAKIINSVMNTVQVNEINIKETDLSEVVAKLYKL